MCESIPVIDGRYAVFTCILCERENKIDVSHYIAKKSFKLNILCPCGNRFHRVLEFRKSIRKKSGLSGIYKTFDKDGKEISASMKVENISWLGLQFRMNPSKFCIKHHDLNSDICKQENPNNRFVFKSNHFAEEDTLRVEFFLDDPKKSFISKDVIVKWIKGDRVGVKFIKYEEFDPSLRFYLLGLQPA